MHNQQRRTLQTTRTTLAPAQVLAEAKRFFARRNHIYAAFPDREGPTFVSMRGQGSEEVLVGVVERDGATDVTGSSYLFDQQLARFFATLPPAPEPEALPMLAGGVVAEGTTGEAAPPAGAATGTGSAGGTGNATGSAGGSPA
jgi:hypothetical protein